MTPSLRDYIERRFADLHRFFDRPECRLHVEIDKPTGRPDPLTECRAILHVPGGQLVVHKRSRDVYRAVDETKKALKRVLEDWHDRLFTRARHPKKYYLARLMTG